MDPSLGDGIDIATWMRTKLKQARHCSITGFMDEEIMYWPKDDQEKALELLDLAVSCTQVVCQSRPSMREVVSSLIKIGK